MPSDKLPGAASTQSILIISSFPPARCGMGTYAQEQVDRLVESGALVQRISIHPKVKGDRRFILTTISGLVKWCLFGAFNKNLIYLHYADIYFFPETSKAGWLGFILRGFQFIGLFLLGATAGKKSHIIIHEIYTGPGLTKLHRYFKGKTIGAFGAIQFHTEVARQQILREYPSIPWKKANILNHGQNMRPKFVGTQKMARETLGLPQAPLLFLCIGLISHHKGFDQAIKAFKIQNPPGARLAIVGWAGHSKHGIETATALQNQVGKNDQIILRDEFVADEALDAWLQAADVVILPYRSVNSSGIGARAKLYGKKLVISDLPNLREQFPEAEVFTDEVQLANIFQKLAHQP